MERSEDIDKDLKPCPFCGGEPFSVTKITSIDGEFCDVVSCRACSNNGRMHSEMTIEQWNARATDNIDKNLKPNWRELLKASRENYIKNFGEGILTYADWVYADLEELLSELDSPAVGDRVLVERDAYHSWADKLADQISKITNTNLGEHSNLNNPWAEAITESEYYLASRNLIRGAVEPIKGLKEVLSGFIRYPIRNEICFLTSRDRDILIRAATKYYEMTKGGI